jgi:sugar (pentulose or hexulose) kinase
MAIAVLDVGKTSVKLAVTDREGRVHESRSCPNRVLESEPYPHADTEGTWEWILATLRELGSRHPLECIVPVGHGACAALVDERGLVLPMLDYEHDLSDVDADYEPLARDFQKSGSPRLPRGLNLGRQLFWLEKKHPQRFAHTRHILAHPQYWAFRLSGVACAEVTSLGCHTDLWEPAKGRFSAFADQRGYSQLFPRIVPAWQRLGPISTDVAQKTGLRSECQVLAGVHDSNASYFAYRTARSGPFTVVSTGTWTVIMAGGRSASRLDPDRDMLANVDAFGDAVACCRFMGGREFHAIAGADGLAVDADQGALERILHDRVLALPSFADQGGPFRGMPGRITALDFASRAAPIERAALATLYTALLTDYCLELLGALGNIVVDGRFSKNRLWLSILAALRTTQAVLASEDEGSSRGAAALAAWPEHLASNSPRECTPLTLPGLFDYRSAWRAALPEGGKSASSSR